VTWHGYPSRGEGVEFDPEEVLGSHKQCDVNYREIRRATVWSYEFHRRIDGRVPPAEGTRPYEKLPIPTDLAIVQITLLVEVPGSYRRAYEPTGRLRDNLVQEDGGEYLIVIEDDVSFDLVPPPFPLGPYSRTMPRALRWSSIDLVPQPLTTQQAPGPDFRG
jgi:hypothetical protein